jgi:hypothetical protein
MGYSQNDFCQYAFTEKRNSVKAHFRMTFQVVTFAVMIVWNVLQAAKSWQCYQKSNFVWFCDKIAT